MADVPELDRLSQTVEFCRLTDRGKFVQRRTYLSDGERLENDAETSSPCSCSTRAVAVPGG